MNLPEPAAQAIKTAVGLLVDGEYDTFWHMTGKIGAPEDLGRRITEYGRTLVFPPDSAFADFEHVYPGTVDERPGYDVDFPLWTKEEGQSELELSLTLTEVMPGIYDTRFRDLRVP